MRLVSILLISFVMVETTAQNLSSHQWEDRVLLVFTQDTSQVQFKQQIDDLAQNQQELEDRKLVVYQVTPSHNLKGVVSKGKWQAHKAQFNAFLTSRTTFEVVLIGLDGGVKLRSSKLITPRDLFATIDGMPMRRAEMRKNKK